MSKKFALIIALLTISILMFSSITVQAATSQGNSHDFNGDGTGDLAGGLAPINGALTSINQSWGITYEVAVTLTYGTDKAPNQQAVSVVKTPDNRYFKIRAIAWNPTDKYTVEYEELTPTLPDAPTAGFSSGVAGLTATFTDTSSGAIDTWLWDFGDGGASNAQSPSHVYANGGSYNVCLTVANAGGSDQTCQNISIQPAPTGNFTFATSGLTVYFTDTSTDDPTAWAWTFGDGSTSNQQHPSHTYASGGSYSVCLTVTNASGSTNSCSTVSVSQPKSGSGKSTTVTSSSSTFAETVNVGPIRPGLDIGGAPALLIVQDDHLGRPSLVVYGIGDTGVGYLAFVITEDDMKVDEDHEQSEAILEGPDEKQFFYMLDSGEIQVNIGPDIEGKVQEIILTQSFEIVERREFNIYDVEIENQ